MIDTVVIGAGLTGLTTAFYLKRGCDSVVVLEECSSVGGQIQSCSRDGFLFEKGPNTGVISTIEIAELFEDLSNKDLLEIACQGAKRRLIWKKGAFRALPSGLFSAVTTPLFSFGDKMRILFEPLRKKGDNPYESLGDLTVRRLGQSFLDYAVDPFISGIYAGDPYRLVTKYAMPKLYALEQQYGSFIKGAMSKARMTKSGREKKVTKDVFSARGGLSALTDALSKAVGEGNITLQAKDVRLKYMSDHWVVSYTKDGCVVELTCRNVVTTVGAFRLAELFERQEIEGLDRVTSLNYAPVVQVSVGVDGCDEDRYRAFGGLVPSKEHRDVLGILYPSSCFEGRAPNGAMLFSVFMGGVRKSDICSYDDSAIREIVCRELKNMLNIEKDQISFMEISRYNHAIAQYDATQGDRLEAVKEIEQQYNGLYLGGALKDGIGMSDRVKQGVAIAKNILK